VGDITYVDDLEDVGRWLEDFHPRSWLELDYGGLARRLGAERLAQDTSVEDVAEALDALTEGDDVSAAAAYRLVVERWARVRALEHAN
jgi:thioesterase domain-containing protein